VPQHGCRPAGKIFFLNQKHPSSQARCRNSGAYARKARADYSDIRIDVLTIIAYGVEAAVICSTSLSLSSPSKYERVALIRP